jgi:hypothetical protein
MTLLPTGIQFGKIVTPKVLIRLLFSQHMIENDQDAVRNRHNGFLLATTTCDPMIQGAGAAQSPAESVLRTLRENRYEPECAPIRTGDGAAHAPSKPGAVQAVWPASVRVLAQPTPRHPALPVKASSISRPLLPRISVATAASLILAPSNTFCKRLISCARSCTSVLR